MRVPLGWLSEWVPLPPLEALVERLTLAGLEIEDVIFTGPALDAVRVGLVLERAAHPDADRLSVCRVDVGADEPLEIVCGAPNVAAGQKVAVATVGTVLPDGTKIKRSRIRGVASQGMICSERELELGDGHEGILVLADDAPVGAPLSEVHPAGETVLDLEITPNRGDWVSMLGMAREVRAHFGGALRLPPTEPPEADTEAAEHVSVEVRDAEGCPRYVARVVHDVEVGESPAWLRERLEAAGLRAVNNVVDVTNLVMLELGQPLHAFDLDTLRGPSIRVRAAEDGEKIETLDGQRRELRPEDLVIADEGGAIAVAGVMGGAESEVGPRTRHVLLESALFAPARVRRTARRLGLHSDAAYRFERGVDPDGQRRAADRAARLLAEIAGGRVARGAVEALGATPPLPPETIRLETARVNRLLGTGLGDDEVAERLARVDVETEPEGPGVLRCRPPRWRGDLHLPADLIEEVARLVGYDRIDSALPHGAFRGVSAPERRATREAVRDGLAAAGLAEVMTFPGAPEDDPDALRLGADDPRRRAVRVVNPIQAGEPRLRTHLLPSLLRVVRTNRARQVERIALFEVGRVFLAAADGEGLPDERLQAAAVLCETADAPGLWERPAPPPFFRAKGLAERVLAGLQRPGAFQATSDEPFLHPGASAAWRAGGRTLAVAGELHPDLQRHFELEEAVAVVVFDLDAIDARPPEPPRYREVPRHPRVRRDLALLVDTQVAAGALEEAIRARAGSALRAVGLFDRYEGRGVPEGKVSLAFRLDFQRTDRTLTEAEVTKAVERVVKDLAERFGAELR
jgi:phenylalanyl-tRNA synthetase beta chain